MVEILDPKKIGDLLWVLNKLVFYVESSKNDTTRRSLYQYLRKYTSVLMEWEMALLDGNVLKDIDWDDLRKEAGYDDYGHTTRLLRDIEKLYKLAVLVGDGQLKNNILRALYDATNVFLEHIIALGEPESEPVSDKEVDEIERRLEEIMRAIRSPS